MKFERTRVYNFEEALYGMRLPMMSHGKSDSYNCGEDECMKDYSTSGYVIGPNDMKLAQTLIGAGNEHRKFMRQIMVSVTITAPLYWWKEFDTYKVGTVASSTSTMHKLASTPITLECFETDDYNKGLTFNQPADADYFNVDLPINNFVDEMIYSLEKLRQKFIETKDNRYWKELVRWLPNGWLQTRTVTMNYENLRSMYFQRKSHKLSEWHQFCSWVDSLPYSNELIKYQKEEV